MVVTQSRPRLIGLLAPGLAIMLGLGALGLWVSIDQLLRGRSAWLAALAMLLVAGAGSYGVVRAGLLLARPLRLITSDEGFEVCFPTKRRFWRWTEASGFRRWIGPHGSVIGVAFDQQQGDQPKRIITLPAGWPLGVDGMVGFLNTAKAHFDQLQTPV